MPQGKEERTLCRGAGSYGAGPQLSHSCSPPQALTPPLWHHAHAFAVSRARKAVAALHAWRRVLTHDLPPRTCADHARDTLASHGWQTTPLKCAALLDRSAHDPGRRSRNPLALHGRLLNVAPCGSPPMSPRHPNQTVPQLATHAAPAAHGMHAALRGSPPAQRTYGSNARMRPSLLRRASAAAGPAVASLASTAEPGPAEPQQAPRGGLRERGGGRRGRLGRQRQLLVILPRQDVVVEEVQVQRRLHQAARPDCAPAGPVSTGTNPWRATWCLMWTLHAALGGTSHFEGCLLNAGTSSKKVTQR